MKLPILFVLAGSLVAPLASANEVISVNGSKELRNYWVYDHEASLPLAEASGMDTVVPPAMSKKAGPWKKIYSVRIDGTGRVTSADCTDCAPGDPIAPIIAKGLLLERYKPAPGNPKRLPVQALLPAELLPPSN